MPAARPVLYIGNRNYSSWSLRPWLCLKWARIGFEERQVELDAPGYGEAKIAAVLAVSPSGRVPVLHADGAVIWDSLAIAEWAAEYPGAEPLLPVDRTLRALIRSATAEMHSGFPAIRRDFSMNIRRRCKAYGLLQETLDEVARVDALWSGLRAAHGAEGSYLFGRRSMADAFYTPVATRFRTYGIALSKPAQAYADALLTDAAFREWENLVLAEPARPLTRAPTDKLYT